jgi:hypothetical protein
MHGTIPRIDDFDDGASLIGKLEDALAAPMRVVATADKIRGNP